MDTETVFKIISMLDTRLKQLEDELNSEEEDCDVAYVSGAMYNLRELRDHLQMYIEKQVSYAENLLGE